MAREEFGFLTINWQPLTQKSLVADENMNPEVYRLGFHSGDYLVALNIFIKMISKQLTRVIFKRLQHFVLKSLQKNTLVFKERDTDQAAKRKSCGGCVHTIKAENRKTRGLPPQPLEAHSGRLNLADQLARRPS